MQCHDFGQLFGTLAVSGGQRDIMNSFVSTCAFVVFVCPHLFPIVICVLTCSPLCALTCRVLVIVTSLYQLGYKFLANLCGPHRVVRLFLFLDCCWQCSHALQSAVLSSTQSLCKDTQCLTTQLVLSRTFWAWSSPRETSVWLRYVSHRGSQAASGSSVFRSA